jgi:hypothetical protein
MSNSSMLRRKIRFGQPPAFRAPELKNKAFARGAVRRTHHTRTAKMSIHAANDMADCDLLQEWYLSATLRCVPHFASLAGSSRRIAPHPRLRMAVVLLEASGMGVRATA